MDIVTIANELGVDVLDITRLKLHNPKLNVTDKDEVLNALLVENAMINSLVATYNKNIEFLKEYNSELYIQFANYKPTQSFEFVQSGNGIANIHFIDDDIFFYPSENPKEYCDNQVVNEAIHFKYKEQNYKRQEDRFYQINHRYVNEACAILDEVDSALRTDFIKDIGIIPHMLLVGGGLGYIIDSLYKNYSVQSLILIEPNCDLFYASLYAFDYATLIKKLKENNQSFDFIVGKSEFATETILDTYYETHGNFLAEANFLLVHYLDYNTKAFLDFYSKSYYKYFTMLGFCDDSIYGINNTIDCIKKGYNLVRSDIALDDKVKEIPCFVIGNGPSLDDDIAFLRKNQDKALIFACGTALDSLYNAGIKPDFYVASERTYYIGQTLDIFDGTNFLDDIIITTACTTHKNTIRHFNKTLIFDKSDESIVNALCCHKDLLDIKKWQGLSAMNPLVGNAGLSVCMYLGFKNIYLFGLDNGKPALKKTLHSSFSDIYGQKYKARETSEMSGVDLMLDGNFGGKIVSNALYKVSKDFLEEILYNEDVNCYNCSNGALVKYTTPMHSYDISLDDISVSKDEIKDFLLHQKSFKVHLTDLMCESIFDKEGFNTFVDKLIYIVKNSVLNKEIALYNMTFMSNIFASLKKTKDLMIARILGSSSQYFFMFATRALFTIKDENKALECASKILDVYVNLLLDLKHVYSFMPHFIEHDHIKLMHGKIGCDHEGSKAPLINSQFKVIDSVKDGKKKNNFVKRYN